MSYLAARENSNAGWVSGGYRDELIAGTAATAINIATQQVTTMQAQAAKTRHAELLLARRFGLGRGVPQSYANAGAWITGKGRSEEPLEAWDYSIGYAYTIVAELLAGVRYPARTADQPTETSFVVEIDALRPTQVAVRMTGAPSDPLGGLDLALEQAFRARLAQTLPWLARPDPRLVVAARIAIPVSIRYRSAGDVAVFEGEQIVR
jgi:hypothetical protein